MNMREKFESIFLVPSNIKYCDITGEYLATTSSSCSHQNAVIHSIKWRTWQQCMASLEPVQLPEEVEIDKGWLMYDKSETIVSIRAAGYEVKE